MTNTTPANTPTANWQLPLIHAMNAVTKIVVGAMLFSATAALAAPIVVTSTNWGDDTNPATCTLWEAIKTANAADPTGSVGGCSRDHSGEATIELEANGSYLTEGQLPKIMRSMRINGNAATIERAAGIADHRFFNIGNDNKLRLVQLTLRGGRAARGGAVWISQRGTLDGTRLVLADNEATDGGGAIYSRGNVILEETTLRGNIATSGGAIAAEYGRVDISRSTFVDNEADFRGGAIAIFAGVEQLTARNSTFSANQADQGGALSRAGLATSAPDSLVQVTFAGNTTNTLYLVGTTNLTIEKSALHDDVSSSLCAGPTSRPTSNGHNAATDDTCNLNHVDDHAPEVFTLGPLVDDGAYTLVHAPTCDPGAGDTCSILLDQYACDDVNIEGQDQRGVFRYTRGGTIEDPAPQCDIGAYESICHSSIQSPSSLSTLIFTDEIKNDGNVLNSGACAGVGESFHVDTVPAEGCNVSWLIYGQGLNIHTIWFLEDTCTDPVTGNPVDLDIQCYLDPEWCKDHCTSDANDWVASLPNDLQVSALDTTPNDGFFALNTPTCTVPASRYVLEFEGGAVDFWDPDIEICSGNGGPSCGN